MSDEIEGILSLSRSNEHLPVNVGDPSEWTILDCAKAVIAETGSKSQITYCPLPQDDPVKRKPDISNTKRFFGWKPKIDLETGLKLSLKYFQSFVEVPAGRRT